MSLKNLTLILFSILFGYQSMAFDGVNPESNTWNNSPTEEKHLLDGIQARIEAAFVEALRQKEMEPLLMLERQIVAKRKEHEHRLLVYWQAYVDYYMSIAFLQLDDRKKAEKRIFKAIDRMETVEQKSTEDLALLAYAQSFSCQFRPGIVIPFISKKLRNNCKEAIALDSLNLRAYFVLGSNDFYTPEAFGGGKICEGMLLKAIALPEQKVENAFLPSWGKMDAYELLIRWYIRKKEWKLAQKYYQEAIGQYPQSYMIRKLAAKIEEKE
ncbi:MAG: hypothetical protein ACEPOZ_10050 [Marinifilaceae bacterium]